MFENMFHIYISISPLSANAHYTGHDWSFRKAVTPDTVKIMKRFWHFRIRACNLVEKLLLNSYFRSGLVFDFVIVYFFGVHNSLVPKPNIQFLINILFNKNLMENYVITKKEIWEWMSSEHYRTFYKSN